MFNQLKYLVKISRPRFWLYVLGPVLLAIAATSSRSLDYRIIIVLLYATLPANLLIYGVNDIFDYETDKHNPKKRGYEVFVEKSYQKTLATIVVLLNLPFLIALTCITQPRAWIFLAGFLFFGVFYSAWPIRAKIRPIIDASFNILYAMLGFYTYTLISGKYPPVVIILASTLWCMAMHAYSAVPDILADKKAKIRTTATFLGARGTIVFCGLCYLASATLVIKYIGWVSIVGAVVYTSIMIASYLRPSQKQIFSLYKYFPYINMAMGAAIFWYIILIHNSMTL